MRKLNFGRVAPSFIIIGVQKGGTSSLYSYLLQHPQLIAPRQKELHYFDTYKETPADVYHLNFPRSYLTSKIAFEATPNYLYFPGTARKLYEYNPDLKFIVSLRNPVDRAHSAWNMYRQLRTDTEQLQKFKQNELMDEYNKMYSFFYKNEFPSFSEWIKFEMSIEFPSGVIEPSIIKRGYYKEQIETYLQYFSLDSFLFLDFNDFKHDALINLSKIAAFLGISEFKNINLTPKNKRAYSSLVDTSLHNMLLDHFQFKNRGLDTMVDLEMDWLKNIQNKE